MPWVWIIVGIAVAGLVMVVCYAVWLAHKASDLFSEIRMLGTRAQELSALLERVKIPDRMSS